MKPWYEFVTSREDLRETGKTDRRRPRASDTLKLMVATALALPAVLWAHAAEAQTGPADPAILVSGPSAFAGCTADYPQNQPGQYYPDSEVEPHLAVDPRDPSHLVGTFQQDRWSNGGARGLVTRVSFDGGVTWQESVVPGLTLCSNGPYERASDPWVSFAPDGKVFHSALTISTDLSGIAVSRSLNGGVAWEPPVVVVEERGPSIHDKESITADWTDSGGHLAYAVWDRWLGRRGASTTAVQFSRTTDGGLTWESPRTAYDPGSGNTTSGQQILVLPDGSLIDFFTEWRPVGSTYDVLLSLMFSLDKGVTWQGPEGAPLRPIRMYPAATTVWDAGKSVRASGSMVDVAVDHRTGQLYVVWEDGRFGQSPSIALSTSINGGYNWSEPIMVSQTPRSAPIDAQQAFTPSVAVADDGTVAVTYYDLRFDDPTLLGGMTDHWMVRCRPSGTVDCLRSEDWTREARLTDSSFDMERVPDANGLFVGDYVGLGAAGRDFVAFFSLPQSDPASVFFRRVRP